MVTLLITALFILVFLVVAAYFWQKPGSTAETELLPPQPHSHGLFSDVTEPDVNHSDEAKRAEILERANEGDRTSLQEAKSLADPVFYNEVLNCLVQFSHGPKLLALASYISRHDLTVNKSLAEKFLESWRSEPGRDSTAKMLHIAALANDARVYGKAVEAVVRCWKSGGLPDISAQELRSLVEGEFWLLSSSTRSSGDGFVLKRTLADARREIEAAER